MDEVGFPWNGNTFVNKAYDEDNYKIINTKAAGNRAICFCSGNGLYFPNTEQEFRRVVVEENRYEWMNLAKNRLIKKTYSKIIFIRDIYKQWYVKGINSKIDNVEKLGDFLESVCEGYKVTIVGNSAGGYAAVLLGRMIKADIILSMSGQFNLWLADNPGPYIDEYRITGQRTDFFDLNTIIDDGGDEIFYFYPAKCESDIIQNEAINSKKIHRLSFDEDKHGVIMRGISYIYTLIMTREELLNISNHFVGEINEDEFYKSVVPWSIRVAYKLKQWLH